MPPQKKENSNNGESQLIIKYRHECRVKKLAKHIHQIRDSGLLFIEIIHTNMTIAAFLNPSLQQKLKMRQYLKNIKMTTASMADFPVQISNNVKHDCYTGLTLNQNSIHNIPTSANIFKSQNQ